MSKYEHLIDIIFAAKNAGKTQAEIEKVFKSMDKGSKDTDKATNKMADFEKALRRVIIVAPIWMAARTVMMSFIRGFSEGFKYMEDFNAAMLKAQAVTHGAVGNMNDTMNDLAGRIRNLATETGESMTKIANAFYQFGTVGIKFEQAWQGAEAATRFAIATQEDSAKVAKILALTFKVLGDTVDQNIPPQQAMEVQLAKMYKLWQVNAGEAGELTESLRAFLPTANTMNLTMDETIALLSTLNSAAMLGSRGGTLLRTSFSKLVDNAEKLASSLGIYVNPQLDTTFDVMMKVLGAIKQLAGTQAFPAAAQEIISSIFGGVRGGEPVKALVALYDQLQENLGIVNKGYSELSETLEDYKKRQDDVINSVSGQLKIFRELRKQVFEQFITGVTGADEFAEALQRVNVVMKYLAGYALRLGQEMQKAQLAPQAAFFTAIFPKKKVVTQDIKEDQETQERFAKIITDYNEKNIKQKAIEEKAYKNLLRQIDLQKRSIQEQIAIQNLINEGYSESDILIADIANEVSKIVDQYNSLDAIQNKIVPQLSKQELLSSVLSENWEDVLRLTNQQPFIQEKLLGLAKSVNQIELQRTQILQKQQEQYTDIYAKYQQADMFEKARIRRMLELREMTPQDLVRAFENEVYDKELILEYWNTFSQEGQNAIGEVIRRLYDLPEATLKTTLTPGAALGAFAGITPAEQIRPITEITNVGAQNVQVNVDLGGMPTIEEMTELLAEQIKEGLLTDANFQDALGRIYNIRREK